MKKELFFSENIRNSWQDPLKATYVMKSSLEKKRMLFKWYEKIYEFMADNRADGHQNLEIGSGSSFLYKFIPDLIRSNILKLDDMDLIFSAYDMPFKDNSLDNIFLISVFHHLSTPLSFLQEAARILRKGGKVFISDPYISLLSYTPWVKLHPEPCNTRVLGFSESDSLNPLTGANSASATIMFFKNHQRYVQEIYPLKSETVKPHTKFHYWLAGGYNFPQFVPTFCMPIIDFMEKALSPLDRLLASFLYVVLVKVDEQ